jgi:hypothetical protein
MIEETREYDHENRYIMRNRIRCAQCGALACILFAGEYLCETCLCPDEEQHVENFVHTRCALSYEENMEQTSTGSHYSVLQRDLTESMRKQGMLDPLKQAMYARHGRKANEKRRGKNHYVRSFVK